MQLLPAELKIHIVELSSGSPNSLAALARTHTSFQREAEKALYDTLSISPHSNDSLKCMKTLATNSEKAALVRFLTVEYNRDSLKRNRVVTNYLSTILINMHSLSDFRVRARPGNVEEKMIKGLCKKILRSVSSFVYKKKKSLIFPITGDYIYSQGHLRLQTFYCHDVLDISLIIKNLPELQILGLYAPKVPGDTLKTLRELHNAQLFLPIVLTLQRESFISVPDHISIFPAYCSVDRRATIHQALAQSLCQDRGSYMVADTDSVHELSIYLIDSSDMSSTYALAKNMAVSFPQVGWINLWFERQYEMIVSFLLTVNEYNPLLILKGV